jgi:putative flavoprotein involved in K+ transport
MRELRTGTVVVGGGQAGLSLSHHLARAHEPHVVLERGRIGERWTSARWESLTLLTPNWLNRLDGGEPHAAPDGFLSSAGFARYLRRYRLPQVREQVEVLEIEHDDDFRVVTDTGVWRAPNVVVATGDAADPFVPAPAATAPAWLRQLHSSRYRSPSQLPAGGVLVVGAGPSGQQIAAELRRAGRDVVLAAGRHARGVRRYRGHDLFHWLGRMGDLERRIDDVADPEAARRTPPFSLTGANGGEQLDLGVLDGLGVTVAARLVGFRGSQAWFADDLEESVADADRRLRELLDRIDDHIDEKLPGFAHDPDRPDAVRIERPPTSVELSTRDMTTVIWATGYRREYPWLHVPALDETGELLHQHGVTDIPGLYTLGLRFQRRRASHFIGGVGADAAFVACRIAARRGARSRRLLRHA